jgi:hypothetical protein
MSSRSVSKKSCPSPGIRESGGRRAFHCGKRSWSRERFAKFSLELHPGKTRLIEFGRHAARARAARGLGKPETFAFLGFTHICGKGRSGQFWLRRITIAKRMWAMTAMK